MTLKFESLSTVPHPKAWNDHSYVVLHESADAKARTGPNFVQLMAEQGPQFLRDIFALVSAGRVTAGKDDAVMVINSTTADTAPNRVSQNEYFHAHLVIGDAENDEFIQNVTENVLYGQPQEDQRSERVDVLKRAVTTQKLEKITAQMPELAGLLNPAVQIPMSRVGQLLQTEGDVEVFAVDDQYALAPYHRVVFIHGQTVETMLNNPEALKDSFNAVRSHAGSPSERTGLRIVLDTVNFSDHGRMNEDQAIADKGVVLHLLGDLNEELVPGKGDKMSQRRWFEPRMS